MRILLTGKNGQIGWELQHTLRGLGELFAPGRDELDLARPDQIREQLYRIGPDLVVNAAAYTAVDRAEDEPEAARAANAEGPATLAEMAAQLGAALVHYSTDYVFDGKKSRPYTEEDPPNPLGVYGETKRAGEQAVRESGVPHLILRTAWVYGARGKNFFLTMLRLARERDELRVVDDQVGAPTWCRSIAETTRHVIDRLLEEGTGSIAEAVRKTSGTYHMTCSGQTTWYGFTRSILQHAHLDNPPRLIPLTTADYPTPAARPPYSVLSNEKLKNRFGLELPPWEEALKKCLDSRTAD